MASLTLGLWHIFFISPCGKLYKYSRRFLFHLALYNTHVISSLTWYQSLTRAICASNCLWSFLKFATFLTVLGVRDVTGSFLFSGVSFRLRFDSTFATAPPFLTRVIAIGILLQQRTSTLVSFYTLLTFCDSITCPFLIIVFNNFEFCNT